MAKPLDMTGQRFGRLVALEEAGNDKHGKKRWLFQCDCGNTKVIGGAQVRKGATTSCGCFQRESTAKRNTQDISGQTFARLTAIRATGRKRHGANNEWEFRCECGNLVYSTVHAVKSGNTNSCGCYGKDRVAETQRLNVVGKTFGDLTAIRFSHNRTKSNGNLGSACYVWQCKCGNELVQTAATITGRFKKQGFVGCRECGRTRQAETRTIDLTGQRFGMLVALKKISEDKAAAQAKWLWQCDCGNTCERYASNTRSHRNANCGCSKITGAADRTGERFGSLVALRSLGKRPGENTYTWEFQCDCGNLCEARLRDAVSGLQQSCGCRQGGYDSIAGWIDGEFRNREDDAFFYVFPLARFDGYAKPGIAEDLEVRKRGSRGEYGDVYDYIALPRIEAWLIEQAVLNATRLMTGCPAELSDRKWEGYTEVRRMEPQAAFDMAIEFHDQLQELGRERFAIQHIPMTPGERNALERFALRAA